MVKGSEKGRKSVSKLKIKNKNVNKNAKQAKTEQEKRRLARVAKAKTAAAKSKAAGAAADAEGSSGDDGSISEEDVAFVKEQADLANNLVKRKLEGAHMHRHGKDSHAHEGHDHTAEHSDSAADDDDGDDDCEGVEDSSSEKDYDRGPRVSRTWKAAEHGAVETRLPIIGPDGKRTFAAPVVPEDEEEMARWTKTKAERRAEAKAVKHAEAKAAKVQAAELAAARAAEAEVLTPAAMIEQRKAHVTERKFWLASTCKSILEAPENGMESLGEVVAACKDKDALLRRLAILSAAAVFKDILPAYPIRAHSSIETDGAAMVSKDVLQLRTFERSLVEHYSKFLFGLESTLNRAQGVLRGPADGDAPAAAAAAAAAVAVTPEAQAAAEAEEVAICQTFCVLLAAHPDFNFSANVLKWVVRGANSPRPGASNACLRSIVDIFRGERDGKLSLRVVSNIADLVSGKKFNVRPAILQSLVHLKFDDVARGAVTLDGVRALEDGHGKLLSRSLKKAAKKRKALERELAETAAATSRSERQRAQTETLHKVFLTYFRILKKAPGSILLPEVLDGLARQAHLINIDFMEDLFGVFRSLAASRDLSLLNRLRTVHVAFAFLQGEGAALSIDLREYFIALYAALGELLGGGFSAAEAAVVVPMLLLVLETVFSGSSKDLVAARVAPFVKRVAQLAALLEPGLAYSLLFALRRILCKHTVLQQLLESEKTALGIFHPEVEDPHHCNGMAASWWEGFLLERHYHPAVATLARHMVEAAEMPTKLGRTAPAKFIGEYSTSEGNFNPAIQAPLPHPLRKKAAAAAAAAEKTGEAPRAFYIRRPPPTEQLIEFETAADAVTARTAVGFGRHFERMRLWGRIQRLSQQKDEAAHLLRVHALWLQGQASGANAAEAAASAARAKRKRTVAAAAGGGSDSSSSSDDEQARPSKRPRRE